MRHPLSFLGGLLAGAVAMYYLDSHSGRRRRALVRDKVVGAGHDLTHYAGAKGKRVMDRLQGVMATHRLDRVSHAMPHSDQQLHDRIRSRLGRCVGHPRLVEVHVAQGQVRLGGHVLRREVEALCREVGDMAGVAGVHNELQLHDHASQLPHSLAHEPAPAGNQVLEISP